MDFPWYFPWFSRSNDWMSTGIFQFSTGMSIESRGLKLIRAIAPNFAPYIIYIVAIYL